MVNKLELFFDIDSAAQPNKSGVGHYSLGLLEALASTGKFDITAHYFNFLGQHDPEFTVIDNVTFVSSKIIHRKLFNLLKRFKINIPIELLTRHRFDFAVFPNFTNKASLLKTPYCVTVHDLAFLKFADTVSGRNQSDLKKFVPKAISDAQFIICISNSMAKEIQETYKIQGKPTVITHIPPTINPRLIPLNSEGYLKKLGINQEYILFIGNLEPRKNLPNLVRAYLLLSSTIKHKYKLVICGSLGWNNGELLDLLEEKNKKNIILTGYVDEPTKYALYKNASLVVLPSFYEGYGMTAIEAMYFDKPLAVSNIPVLHEITNNQANFFDPNSTDSIKDALEQSLTSPNKYNTKSLLKDLTWQKVTSDLVGKILEFSKRS